MLRIDESRDANFLKMAAQAIVLLILLAWFYLSLVGTRERSALR